VQSETTRPEKRHQVRKRESERESDQHRTQHTCVDDTRAKQRRARLFRQPHIASARADRSLTPPRTHTTPLHTPAHAELVHKHRTTTPLLPTAHVEAPTLKGRRRMATKASFRVHRKRTRIHTHTRNAHWESTR
jgi:hypothetical protein